MFEIGDFLCDILQSVTIIVLLVLFYPDLRAGGVVGSFNHCVQFCARLALLYHVG